MAVTRSSDAGIASRTNGYAYGTRTMPMKSERQRRAMHAAAAGKSTLGIPKSVGREYVASGMAPRKRRKNGLRHMRM